MVFTGLFTVECAVKLLGYGLAGFFADGMNWFDAIIVVLSLVDTFASVSVLLAADTSPGYAQALDLASNVLTGLFALEIALQILGLGAWGFLSNASNVFGLLLVVVGLLELALTVRNGAACKCLPACYFA